MIDTGHPELSKDSVTVAVKKKKKVTLFVNRAQYA